MNSPSDAYIRFQNVLTLGENALVAGDVRSAAALAQIAARYAFPANAGLFGSHRLERLLLDIGSRIPSPADPVQRRPHGSCRSILHVLSYGRPVGGDTRLVWRWIQEDAGNRHSIAITAQSELDGQCEIPEALQRSAERTGGFLRALCAPTSHPIEQARELRMLSREMDFVILHLFPYDIVPALALAAGCDSVKTIFVNLCDHTFWAGAGVAHSIVHLRTQTPEFLVRRRGLNLACSSSILPIPLSCSSPPAISADEAKRGLGYGREVTLLLTIASPFKYRSPGATTLLDLVVPVLAECPQAVLLAVGPEFSGEWKAAHFQTNGRIVPLGTRWDNELLYAAAEVYLDSVPFSSITSLLEAGSHATPLLGYKAADSDLSLMGPGAPGLARTMAVATDADTYRRLLVRLITEPDFRRKMGLAAQSTILAFHTGEKWMDAVRAVYAEAEAAGERCCLSGNNDECEPSRLSIALGHLYPKRNVRRLLTHHLGALPYGRRLSLTLRLCRKGFDLAYLNLLPWPANIVAHSAGRWVKSAIREARCALVSPAPRVGRINGKGYRFWRSTPKRR